MLLTTMDPEVLLQMVLVFEGLATLRAFELAVAGRLVEQLVLPDRQGRGRERVRKNAHTPQKRENPLDRHGRRGWG